MQQWVFAGVIADFNFGAAVRFDFLENVIEACIEREKGFQNTERAHRLADDASEKPTDTAKVSAKKPGIWEH